MASLIWLRGPPLLLTMARTGTIHFIILIGLLFPWMAQKIPSRYSPLARLKDGRKLERRIAEAQRTGATKLDLGGLRLVEIPAGLGQLAALQKAFPRRTTSWRCCPRRSASWPRLRRLTSARTTCRRCLRRSASWPRLRGFHSTATCCARFPLRSASWLRLINLTSIETSFPPCQPRSESWLLFKGLASTGTICPRCLRRSAAGRASDTFPPH